MASMPGAAGGHPPTTQGRALVVPWALIRLDIGRVGAGGGRSTPARLISRSMACGSARLMDAGRVCCVDVWCSARLASYTRLHSVADGLFDGRTRTHGSVFGSSESSVSFCFTVKTVRGNALKHRRATRPAAEHRLGSKIKERGCASLSVALPLARSRPSRQVRGMQSKTCFFSLQDSDRTPPIDARRPAQCIVCRVKFGHRGDVGPLRSSPISRDSAAP